MMINHKTLKVSYGTFSYTLEVLAVSAQALWQSGL